MPLARVGINIRSLGTKLKTYSPAFMFMSPAAILVMLFYFLPVIVTLWISTTDMSVATFRGYQVIGLVNYAKMLASRWTPRILKNTAFYVIATLTCFNVGMALVLALLTTHINKKVGMLFRALWLLPRITPSVIYALLWIWATADAPFGIINQLISPLGVEPRNWMMKTPWAVIILANGFVGASFGMIIFTSAIESILPDYLMAAKVDGASTLQTIRYIILPMIKWPILFVLSYQTLSLLASYEYILLLTNGGPGFYTTEVWSLYAFHLALSNYFGNVQFGYGSALAAVLVVIGIITSVIYLRVFKFRELVAEPKIDVL
ncbi:MAG TPA: sugar ABC transporter permease [Anaerolineae bacterium]|nr:sugar ABC transporter permease [Anaerolineae bacterium]